MKTMKNKKGFTLIELLAVIVVLAIVTVLATTTMLPLMNKAVTNGFVDEANAARESAANIMTLVSIGSFDTTGDGYTENGNNVCITLQRMAEEGMYDKDIEFFTSGEYEGKVIITKKDASSNNYTYEVKMHNKTLYVDKVGKVSDTDVSDYDSEKNTGFDC